MKRTTKMSPYFSHGPFPMKTLPSYSELVRGFLHKRYANPLFYARMFLCPYVLTPHANLRHFYVRFHTLCSITTNPLFLNLHNTQSTYTTMDLI